MDELDIQVANAWIQRCERAEKERDTLRAQLAAIKGEFEAQGIHDWGAGGWADTNYPTLAKLMRGRSC